jgi:two-component system, cell cycle response regulator
MPNKTKIRVRQFAYVLLFIIITCIVAYLQFSAMLGVDIEFKQFILPTFIGLLFGSMYAHIRTIHDTMQQQKEFARSIIEAQESIIVVINVKKEIRILEVNQRFFNFFNIKEPKRILKHKNAICHLLEPYCQDNNTAWLHAAIDNIEYECIVKFTDSDKQKTYYFNIKRNVLNLSKQTYVLTFDDVTTLQEEKLKFAKSATTDKLTELMNRDGFDAAIEQEFDRGIRYENEFSIILIDIDHFKHVNDTYGHITGDNILKRLATLFKEQIRKTDIVARWGGEEFIILSPNTNDNQARVLAQKLRKAINDLTHLELEDNITCSFGISQFKKDDTQEILFKRADEALYYVKNNGRDGISVN